MSKAVEIERLVLMAALAFPQADPEPRDITEHVYSFESVLDAIALLCVKKPKKEAFACAMQLDSNASAVYLTLATDDNVPPHAVNHIQDLWSRLKELSDLRSDPDLKLQTIAFRKAVYAYSAARQLHVFYKHFDPLRSFITQAMEYRDKNLAFEKVIWFDHLNTISKIMAEFSETFPQGQSTDTESFSGEEMGRLMDALPSLVAEVFKNKHLYNFISKKFDPEGITLPMERLKKLIMLPNSIDAILHVACSRRYKPHFQHTLHVNHVGVNNLGNFSFPSNWPEFVSQHFPDMETSHVIQAIESRAFDSEQANVKRQAHCECTLAAFIYSLSTKPSSSPYIQPLDYLGTSKSPCAACVVYLDTLPQQFPNAPLLQTQSSSGKWRRFWAYPSDIQDEQLISAVCDMLRYKISLQIANESDDLGAYGSYESDVQSIMQRPGEDGLNSIELPSVAALYARYQHEWAQEGQTN